MLKELPLLRLFSTTLLRIIFDKHNYSDQGSFPPTLLRVIFDEHNYSDHSILRKQRKGCYANIRRKKIYQTISLNLM